MFSDLWLAFRARRMKEAVPAGTGWNSASSHRDGVKKQTVCGASAEKVREHRERKNRSGF